MTTDLPERKRTAPTTAGGLWGPRRVRLGLSLRDLAKRSDVLLAHLSLYEQGRGIPTPAEYERIIAALDAAEAAPGSAAEGAPA